MIDQQQAVEIAQKRAIENDWAFAEPLSVVIRKSWGGKVIRYEIESNSGMRGSKARFVIDAATGEITSEGYIPR